MALLQSLQWHLTGEKHVELIAYGQRRPAPIGERS